jgi:hypothetical protein
VVLRSVDKAVDVMVQSGQRESTRGTREGRAEHGCVVLYNSLEKGPFPLVEDAHVERNTLWEEYLQRRPVLDLTGVGVQGESGP